MAGDSPGIGNRIAPWRFVVFVAAAAASGVLLGPRLGWREGTMLSFDIAAFIFLLLCAPLFRHEVEDMRRAARENDANRALLLAITAIVSGVILVSVANALVQQQVHQPRQIALIIGTLALSWLFTTAVYALHYAHIFYVAAPGGGDSGGIEFSDTPEPDYLDFCYFSSCLGMTFQTSDVDITARRVRWVVMFHSMAAFVFNLGVIAFAINVLSGS